MTDTDAEFLSAAQLETMFATLDGQPDDFAMWSVSYGGARRLRATIHARLNWVDPAEYRKVELLWKEAAVAADDNKHSMEALDALWTGAVYRADKAEAELKVLQARLSGGAVAPRGTLEFDGGNVRFDSYGNIELTFYEDYVSREPLEECTGHVYKATIDKTEAAQFAAFLARKPT